MHVRHCVTAVFQSFLFFVLGINVKNGHPPNFSPEDREEEDEAVYSPSERSLPQAEGIEIQTNTLTISVGELLVVPCLTIQHY